MNYKRGVHFFRDENQREKEKEHPRGLWTSLEIPETVYCLQNDVHICCGKEGTSDNIFFTVSY